MTRATPATNVAGRGWQRSVLGDLPVAHDLDMSPLRGLRLGVGPTNGGVWHCRGSTHDESRHELLRSVASTPRTVVEQDQRQPRGRALRATTRRRCCCPPESDVRSVRHTEFRPSPAVSRPDGTVPDLVDTRSYTAVIARRPSRGYTPQFTQDTRIRPLASSSIRAEPSRRAKRHRPRDTLGKGEESQ